MSNNNSKWFIPYLMTFYVVPGALLIYYIETHVVSKINDKATHDEKQALTGSAIEVKDALMILSILHLGFVLAISFMEAWVKFNAPFMPRHIGFDVGRHVFTASNAVEVGITTTIMALLYKYVPPPSLHVNSWVWKSPAIIYFMVFFQTYYLTPKLEMRGKHTIVSEISKELAKSGNGKGKSPGSSPSAFFTPKMEEAYKALKAETTLDKEPPLYLHKLYIVLELAKVAMICYNLYRFLSGDFVVGQN